MPLRSAHHVKFGTRRLVITAAVVAALTPGSFLPSARSALAATGGNQTLQTITRTGTGGFSSGPAGLADDSLTQALPHDLDADLNPHTGHANFRPPKTSPAPVGT